MSYDDQSPLIMEDGNALGKLIIKDRKIGKMVFAFSRMNITGKYGIRSSLELIISDSGNNLQNLNTEEYHDRIANVFDYLKDEYGIEADLSSLKIKRLELNATFFLNEPYEKYRYPILMIMRNMPPKRFGQDSKNNAVKYATWHAADMVAQEDKLETALVKNSSLELKIYNKGHWLRDKGFPLAADRDIMRVEYTIKDPRILKNNFGDELVSSLSDEKITAIFKKYFNRDVASRYYEWAAQNQRDLTTIVDLQRKAEKHWVGYFLRYARQYNETHGLPILFDLEDMRKVFQTLEPKRGKNVTNKYKRFIKNAKYEEDLMGNTRRIREIINKILNL